MLTIVRESVAGQFGAALGMLGGCIEKADPDTWHATVGRAPYWHVAYHALYFADLYLSADERSFRPPPVHRQDYQFLGHRPWPPFEPVVADRPYVRDTLAEYARECQAKASRVVTGETQTSLAGPSGFAWLNFSRLELHVYNIRHVQHHAGQLAALLRRQSGGRWAGWKVSGGL